MQFTSEQLIGVLSKNQFPEPQHLDNLGQIMDSGMKNFEIAIYCYMYGVMIGKRQERGKG